MKNNKLNLFLLKFLMLFVCLIITSCNKKHEALVVSSKHNLLFDKIYEIITNRKIVLYTDYDLHNMKGIDEIHPLKVRRPFVMEFYDEKSIVKNLIFDFEWYFIKSKNRFVLYTEIDKYKLFYNIMKIDSIYVDFYQYYKPPTYAFTFYYPNKLMFESFSYQCKEFNAVHDYQNFSDTSCILDLYQRSYRINDTIFHEKFTFNCCNFEEPPFRNRSTYGLFLSKDFSYQKLLDSPELTSFEYRKIYEQEDKIVMEDFTNWKNPQLTISYYEKHKYISINWVFALFSNY